MKRLKRIFLISLTMFLAVPAMAGSLPPEGIMVADSGAADEEELQQLLTILDKYTEIATKTRINADFVPGMVTVLEGDDLDSRGIRTVWEALGLVPGLELSIQGDGGKKIIVRGIGQTLGSGTAKILLNSVSMNATFGAQAQPVLLIPVEQVERIEVIRGPGSALYGEFAYVGVINIITRKEGNRIFGHAGRYDTYEGGGLLSWAHPDRELRMSLNLAGMETDGANIQAGPDTTGRMGRTDEKRDAGSGIFTLDYKGFSFVAQFAKENHGHHFGVTNILPDPEITGSVDFRQGALKAQQHLDLSSSLQADLKLGWQEYWFRSSRSLLFSSGAYINGGAITTTLFEESRFNGEVDITWEGWDRHTLLAGLFFSHIDIDDTWHETNYYPLTFAPLPSFEHFEGAENWIAPDENRELYSLTLQDEFRFNELFTLTAGVRYDHYDDFGDAIAPRIAGVWRLADRHTLKIQYGSAFRPPTFLEMYVGNNPALTGNPAIDPATVDTYEFGYIFKEKSTVGRATFFYSNLTDLIVVEGGTYINADGARVTGVELELEQKLTSTIKLDANISYTDNEDKDTGEPIAGTTNWLANLGLLYEPWQDVLINLQYRYVGERDRDPADTRSDLDDYQTVDVTGSLFNLGTPGLTFRASVKNLFDEDVRYPAPMNTYPEDYPRPGREWWLGASYEF